MSTTLIGPAIGAVVAIVGWLLAQSRDEHGLPRRGRVRVGEWLAMTGLVVALLTLPRDLSALTYAAAITGTLLAGLLLVRGAGRLAIGWTTAAEVLTASAALAWRTPPRIAWSLLSLTGGLTLAIWLATQNEPTAALLGAAVALAPIRWWLPWGASREKTQTGVERALAGLLSGGLEWDGHEASLRGAPVRIHFRNDDKASKVTYPLPPSWKASAEENLEEDLRARLSRWGYWLTHVDASARVAVAEAVEPLPAMIEYAGETASDTGDVVLGQARLSRKAAKSKGRQYGQVVPFIWTARTAPHGVAVGTTGGGKSSVFRIIITSWCRHSYKRVILLDPGTTEFELFKGRQNVMSVTDSVESMTSTLREVEAERQRRAALCKKFGVTTVWKLPPDLQPPSWLVVIDEVMDYLDKAGGTSDEAKHENELRAEALDLLIRGEQLARKGDIHYLIAGQRLDKKVVDGRVQNNSPLRILTSVAEAGSAERHMVGLQEIEPESSTPGRGVAKSVGMPESEVQFTFLDEDDLDEWLPMDDAAEREWAALTGKADAASEDEDGDGQTADKKSAKGPNRSTSDGASKSRDDDEDARPDSDPDDDAREPEADPSEEDLDFDLSDFEDDPR